ncbi:MAG: hypothetical protein ACI841_000084 [Planctomycetota bacterium]|jgi:hypothetical protein
MANTETALKHNTSRGCELILPERVGLLDLTLTRVLRFTELSTCIPAQRDCLCSSTCPSFDDMRIQWQRLVCGLGLACVFTGCTATDTDVDSASALAEEGDKPPRITGVWNMESDLQGRTIPANLILTKDDAGGLSGVWESMNQEMELSAVAFDGSVLRFKRPMGGAGELMAFEGSVVDGELHGMQTAGAMEIPCIGKRFRVDHDGPPQPAPARSAASSEDEYFASLERDCDENASRAVPRDSFDVLDMPELVAASEQGTLTPDEYVLGVSLDGEARAYPIGALGSSELLNDTCGGIPIAASW